jgi:glycogen operon protein
MDFRRRHPAFRRHRWFQGRAIYGSGTRDIVWFNPDGHEMTAEQWNDGLAKSIGVFLNGQEIPSPDPQGRRITDDDFLLLFNAHPKPIVFTVPRGPWGGEEWAAVIDTDEPMMEEGDRVYRSGDEVATQARSVVVLQRVK